LYNHVIIYYRMIQSFGNILFYFSFREMYFLEIQFLRIKIILIYQYTDSMQ
jgi:hypothetical protein